ncbi:MAG: FAD-dependent oxidoreductase [Chloroflexi bacterium]|nr:FAD-dependent oxidoreductase [Chloroflexota bacterium]
MPFAQTPRPKTLTALAEAAFTPFWLDDPRRPEPAAPLTQDTKADLVVVGAGFTGLWTALLAKEADPARDVVLLEAGETADGATGRNGGFVAASLTHGFQNGYARWPKELATLIALGQANLEAIETTVIRLGLDCDFVRSGELVAATEPYQVNDMRPAPALTAPYGEKLEWLDGEQTRARVNSPLFLGALYTASGVAMVNPARLAWGLRQACLASGVRLFEHTPAVGLLEDDKRVVVQTPHGCIQTARVALATNAFPPLLKRLSYYVVPVYDYVLATEPLSAAQRATIGWQGREGLSDAGNQFHYSQMTADGRIVWGGYDAVYYWNNGFGPHLERDTESFGRLAEHLFQTFPQLEGLRFTHAWGGAIDTCSRFSPFWGTAYRGRLAYALGYTGLGVGASRFGAQVMLDLLDGRDTERTALEMVRTQPTPFPPEPIRSIGINLTRWSLDQADRNHGRRNWWLRMLDGLGLGFDS